MKHARIIGLFLFVFATACGGDALTGFREIPVNTYPQGVEFRMTVVMTPCSDSCSTYEAATCDVNVDKDNNVIEIDPVACFERTSDECSEMCGGPVIAHCTVPSLTAGNYTVRNGSFERGIVVR